MNEETNIRNPETNEEKEFSRLNQISVWFFVLLGLIFIGPTLFYGAVPFLIICLFVGLYFLAEGKGLFTGLAFLSLSVFIFWLFANLSDEAILFLKEFHIINWIPVLTDLKNFLIKT